MFKVSNGRVVSFLNSEVRAKRNPFGTCRLLRNSLSEQDKLREWRRGTVAPLSLPVLENCAKKTERENWQFHISTILKYPALHIHNQNNDPAKNIQNEIGAGK